jgi:hypothetical protein
MDIFKKGIVLFASVMMLAIYTQAQATQTDTVLNLEGNPTCSSLGDNHAVLEYRFGDPEGNDGITTEIQKANGDYQDLTYTLGEDTDTGNVTVSWHIGAEPGDVDDATNPINYVILKSQGGKTGAKVFHFGSNPDGDKGAAFDSNEISNSSNLAAISFCYGLTEGVTEDDPGPFIPRGNIPICNDINNDGVVDMGEKSAIGDLYTTGISCPESDEEQLIINMSLNAANFGFDPTNIRACTCNTSTPACNAALPAVPRGSQDDVILASERSCMEFGNVANDASDNPFIGPDGSDAAGMPVDHHNIDGDYDPNTGVPAGVNERTPFGIQGVENPDSYYCFVWGGTEYCYGHY